MNFSLFNPFSNFGGGGTSGGGGGTSLPTSTNFSSLPAAAAHAGEVFIVLESQGVWLINRKEAGLYKSSGIEWQRLGNWVDAFKDENFALYDGSDITKVAKFTLDDISALTTRTYTLPNKSGTVALTSDIPDIWKTQDIDDTSVPGFVYGGQIEPFKNKWRIRRVDTSEVVTIADVINNPFFLTYPAAWANRLTLTYS